MIDVSDLSDPTTLPKKFPCEESFDLSIDKMRGKEDKIRRVQST